MQMGHGVPHSIRRRIQCIQPVGLPCVVEPSQDLINEELAFFVRVSSMNDIFTLFQKPSNLIEPLLGWRILMLLIRRLHLHLPIIKVDGQEADVLPVSIFLIIVLRLLQGKQVAKHRNQGVFALGHICRPSQ